MNTKTEMICTIKEFEKLTEDRAALLAALKSVADWYFHADSDLNGLETEMRLLRAILSNVEGK